MATIVPAPAGTGNIAQNFAFASSQLGQGIGQFIAQRRQQQQQAVLRQFLQQQGVQVPTNLPPQFLQQFALQRQELAGRAAIARAKPISPAQQITQKQLNRINLLEHKARQGTITEPEKAELQRSLQRNRPLVEFGALPGLTRLLTPEERVEKAKAPLKKPLTSTEVKGVDATINAILGEPKALPFGVRPGAAISQSKMEILWEQTIEETGYNGRGKIAKKQIEARFDRRIKELNRGKGLGVLANQYEWSRTKWEAKQNLKRRSGESIDDFVKRTGL